MALPFGLTKIFMALANVLLWILETYGVYLDDF